MQLRHMLSLTRTIYNNIHGPILPLTTPQCNPIDAVLGLEEEHAVTMLKHSHVNSWRRKAALSYVTLLLFYSSRSIRDGYSVLESLFRSCFCNCFIYVCFWMGSCGEFIKLNL